MKLTLPIPWAMAACHCACLGLLPAQMRGTLPSTHVEALAPLSTPGSTRHTLGLDTPWRADASATVARLPGASILRNGPQTGLLQVRGLSGERVGVRVDGMTISPACPNHMDPPLHYADLRPGSRMELFAGIAPVSEGGDRIAGQLSVSRPDPRFAEGGQTLFGGQWGAVGRGDHHSLELGADLHYSVGDLALEYRGSAATGGDRRIPGGRVRASGYDLTRHGITAAWRTAAGFVALDAGMSATRDAGTPALPMDMVSDDSWHLSLRQVEGRPWGEFEHQLYLHDIDHLMDNFSNRPPPMMRMETPATSRDIGWRGGLTLPRGESIFRIGLDLHRNEFEARQWSLGPGLYRDMFVDNERGRYGAYLDWERAWGPQWTSRLGVRGDWVTTDAGQVTNQIMPMGAILADQTAFNSADRSKADLLLDAVAALRFEPDERSAVELALALKNRAPSLVERYLWTPLGASAGLADGRTYLGDPNLDPEQSWQVSLAYERRGDHWHTRLSPFYHSVSDFIQGEPIARLDPDGNPVLQFTNLDRVELYGLEWNGALDLSQAWSLEADASYVRGRNRDGGDLYRIAPLHGLVALHWSGEPWSVRLESEWAAAQNEVATAQGETRSPGYGLLHLRVAWQQAARWRVECGVENLLNHRYADHLSGVNRVAGSDVAIGQRIPGAGRFAYVSLSRQF